MSENQLKGKLNRIGGEQIGIKCEVKGEPPGAINFNFSLHFYFHKAKNFLIILKIITIYLEQMYKKWKGASVTLLV